MTLGIKHLGQIVWLAKLVTFGIKFSCLHVGALKDVGIWLTKTFHAIVIDSPLNMECVNGCAGHCVAIVSSKRKSWKENCRSTMCLLVSSFWLGLLGRVLLRLSLDLSCTLINFVSKLCIIYARARKPIALIEKSSIKHT